jgi:hypothetical protein
MVYGRRRNFSEKILPTNASDHAPRYVIERFPAAKKGALYEGWNLMRQKPKAFDQGTGA